MYSHPRGQLAGLFNPPPPSPLRPRPFRSNSPPYTAAVRRTAAVLSVSNPNGFRENNNKQKKSIFIRLLYFSYYVCSQTKQNTNYRSWQIQFYSRSIIVRGMNVTICSNPRCRCESQNANATVSTVQALLNTKFIFRNDARPIETNRFFFLNEWKIKPNWVLLKKNYFSGFFLYYLVNILDL